MTVDLGHRAVVRERITLHRVWIVTATGTAAAVTGFAVSRSPGVAVAAVAVFAVSVFFVLSGREALVAAAIATLPWMVVFNDLLPAYLKTVMSAVAAIAVCLYVWPLRGRNSPLLLWGLALFFGALLYGTLIATSGAQFIQAAKYIVFPIMALAVTSDTAHARLARIGRPILISAALAMGAQVGVIVLGLGGVGTYYGVGEHVGFDATAPAELSLVGVVVACAGLAGFKSPWARIFFVALGLIPALATGTRAAILASVLVLVIFVLQSRFRLSNVVVVAGVVAVILGTGVLAVAETRVSQDLQSGEFASFSTAGSGRGEIWTIALRHYVTSSAKDIVLGTGLRSIEKFEEEDLNHAFVGHSDLLEVGVQLGLIGFAGWGIIWFVLLSDARLSRIVLVPLVLYAAIDGVMEYTAPLVIALSLAAAAPNVAMGDLIPMRRRALAFALPTGPAVRGTENDAPAVIPSVRTDGTFGPVV